MEEAAITTLRALGLDPEIVHYAVELRYICWFAYCIFVVKTHGRLSASTEPGNPPHPFAAFVNCVIRGYGGGLIVPMLMSTPSPLVQSYIPLTFMAIAFLLDRSNHTRNAWTYVMDSRLMQPVLSLAVAMHRSASITDWRIRAESALVGSFLGAFICGTLGGSGGVFMPLPQGLKRIERRLPWGLESAVLVNCALCFVDPKSSVVKGCIFIFLAVCRVFPGFREGLMTHVRAVLAGVLGFNEGEKRTVDVAKKKN